MSGGVRPYSVLSVAYNIDNFTSLLSFLLFDYNRLLVWINRFPKQLKLAAQAFTHRRAFIDFVLLILYQLLTMCSDITYYSSMVSRDALTIQIALHER